MVNLSANSVTMLVVFLSGNIDTVLGSTLCHKFILGVLVQEDVNVAFDLLGRRPVNLAVLLGTFHPVHFSVEFDAALLAACHLIHITSCPHSLAVSTGVHFERSLGLVALGVGSRVSSDSFSTSGMLDLPLPITGLGPGDMSLEHVPNLAAVWVTNDLALLLETSWAFQASNPHVQLVALFDLILVQTEDVCAASLMASLGTLHAAPHFIDLLLVIIIGCLARIPAFVKLVDSMLVVAMLMNEGLLDVTKEELLDGFESFGDVRIQVHITTGLSDAITKELGFHQILHQRSHLGHIATFHPFHEILNDGSLRRHCHCASHGEKRGRIVRRNDTRNKAQHLHVG
jgi:hypothetical protein